jgi:hypothetical protein
MEQIPQRFLAGDGVEVDGGAGVRVAVNLRESRDGENRMDQRQTPGESHRQTFRTFCMVSRRRATSFWTAREIP